MSLTILRYIGFAFWFLLMTAFAATIKVIAVDYGVLGVGAVTGLFILVMLLIIRLTREREPSRRSDSW